VIETVSPLKESCITSTANSSAVTLKTLLTHQKKRTKIKTNGPGHIRPKSVRNRGVKKTCL